MSLQSSLCEENESVAGVAGVASVAGVAPVAGVNSSQEEKLLSDVNPLSGLHRINIGCGKSPTPGWTNFDSSMSIKLARQPIRQSILTKLGLITDGQKRFIDFAAENDIQWHDVNRGLPVEDNSAAVVYSSHMVEHLYPEDALAFFKESQRVLAPGGVFRIAVPNIAWHVQNYLDDQDADSFIRRIKLTRRKPSSLFNKLKLIWLGDRDHKWMYDGPSMCKFLLESGFAKAQVTASGTTTISDPGELNLEERAPESVFVEATNALFEAKVTAK